MTMKRVCSSSAYPSINDLGHSACCTGSGSVRTILLLESSGPPTDPFLLPHLPTGLKGPSKFPRAHVFVAVAEIFDLNAYTRTSPSMVCQSTVGRKEFDRARPYFGLGAFRSMFPEASMTSGQTGPSLSGRGIAPVGITRATGAITVGGHSWCSQRETFYVCTHVSTCICMCCSLGGSSEFAGRAMALNRRLLNRDIVTKQTRKQLNNVKPSPVCGTQTSTKNSNQAPKHPESKGT